MRVLTIPGTPIAKGRPRMTKGAVYTPKRTREAERRIKEFAFWGHDGPLSGPLVMTAVFVFRPPKSWPAWKHCAANLGSLRPDGRPDLDNLVKLLKDGLTVADWWHDDDQVVRIWAEKRYGMEAQTIVAVAQLPPNPTTKKEFERENDKDGPGVFSHHAQLLGMLDGSGGAG